MKKIKNILKYIGSPGIAIEEVMNVFGKMRCRSIKICGSVVSFPDIDMGNIDVDSMNQLNEWVKDLIPDFKVKLGDVPDIRALLDAPSVVDI